jgi:hypothetical protein
MGIDPGQRAITLLGAARSDNDRPHYLRWRPCNSLFLLSDAILHAGSNSARTSRLRLKDPDTSHHGPAIIVHAPKAMLYPWYRAIN